MTIDKRAAFHAAKQALQDGADVRDVVQIAIGGEPIIAPVLAALDALDAAQKQYRICWESRLTGAKGQGEWHDADKLDTLLSQLARSAAAWPQIEHWIEEREAGEK